MGGGGARLAMAAAAAAAKKALRAELKGRVRAIPPLGRAQQSQAVCAKVIQHPAFVGARRVAVYLSMPSEVDTAPVIEELFRTGRQCFIPRYTEDDMEMLSATSVADIASLPKTAWNIAQPLDGEGRDEALASGGLDLILVPGLGFSEDGCRIGRGKGYYDRYLMKSRDVSPDVRFLGLSFAEQLCEEIPVNEHDVTLDAVLSPDAAQ